MFSLNFSQAPWRFRQELFPRHQRSAIDQGEAAGFHLAWNLDGAAEQFDIDSTRHSESGARRLAIRRVDLDDRHSGLRYPRLLVRDFPHRLVRRRILF